MLSTLAGPTRICFRRNDGLFRESPVLIRPATASDIALIVDIERKAIETAHWPEEKYGELLNDRGRIVLVVEDESGVCGFGVARVLDRECEIENLVVSPHARRRGWATQLLRELMGLAAKLGVISFFLEVRESNLAARALYNRSGFIEKGRRKRYYRDPEEDAILYSFL